MLEQTTMLGIVVPIKLVRKDAVIPTYGSAEAAAFDIYAPKAILIVERTTTIIKTGVSLALPPGFCLQVFDRSSMAKKHQHVFGCLIDSDYRGELHVLIHNHMSASYEIKKGDRIAQMAIHPIVQAVFETVKQLPETERGENGLGSTGP